MTTANTPGNGDRPSTSEHMRAPGRKAEAPSARGGIFQRFAARSLRLNRTRTIVSIVGVALSCALITAIFTSVATLYEGLLTAETSTEGAWQVELVNMTDNALDELRADPRVEHIYERKIYGSALMPESFEGYWGRYLDLHAWPTADEVAGLKPLPKLGEGHAPQGPGEIVLTNDLKGLTADDGLWLYDSLPNTGRDLDVPRVKWEGGIQLGTEIELALGQRTFVDPETGQEVPCLYDESLYTSESEKGDVVTEYLADASAARRYTVVGFYAPPGKGSYDVWGGNGPGYLGFVADDELAPRSTSAYITTNLNNRTDIDQLITDYTGLEHALFNDGGNRDSIENMTAQTIAYSHDALLRYQGMLDDRSVWGTLYSLAAILSAVVITASISLIYNSFAISVSERTRQFGLLSSLGASKRQLRRTVYAEALMLAAVGIPAGILIGLAGTFAVFHIAGEGIGMLIDQEAFAEAGFSSIAVNPGVLATSAALALVTVLISAAVPAWRASRVSAVDAIRQTRDVRLSRRERRAPRRTKGGTSRAPRARTLDALRLRMLGVPGLLAHRNLTRASSKGRVAVASLAVSVALIIISGSISHYLSLLTQVADSGGSDIEVMLNRTLADGETTADGIAELERAYRELDSVEGASGEGWVLNSSLYGTFQPGMIDADELLEQDEGYDIPDRALAEDGTTYSPISILYVDDATWRAFLKESGLDESRYNDPENPLAVALNGTQSNDGRRYSVRDLFRGTGTATLFTYIESAGDDLFISCDIDSDGTPIARYEGYGSADEQRYDEFGEPIFQSIERPLADVLKGTHELPVGAVVDSFPSTLRSYASIWPTLVLPVGALPTLAADSEGLTASAMNGNFATPFVFHNAEGAYNNSLAAYLSFAADAPRDVENAMNDIIAEQFVGTEWYRTFLSNNAEHVRTARLMSETVQLFINCFILITGAIAVANVFNTLTNSIILRRREFAMLKSVGMGDRAFWKMIALECLSYAWRGLAIGLCLGALVTLLIYQAMMMSFADLDFVVSAGWVFAAIGVVALVLALSTVYALRKSSAGSIVQTLREDAI